MLVVVIKVKDQKQQFSMSIFFMDLSYEFELGIVAFVSAYVITSNKIPLKHQAKLSSDRKHMKTKMFCNLP